MLITIAVSTKNQLVHGSAALSMSTHNNAIYSWLELEIKAIFVCCSHSLYHGVINLHLLSQSSQLNGYIYFIQVGIDWEILLLGKYREREYDL